MEFECHIRRVASGDWLVQYAGGAVAAVEVAAPTRDAAVEKMRRELQFRLELCPCTGDMAPQVELLVHDEPSAS